MPEKAPEKQAPQENPIDTWEEAVEVAKKWTQQQLRDLKRWVGVAEEKPKEIGEFIEKDGLRFKKMEFKNLPKEKEEVIIKAKMDQLQEATLKIPEKILFDKEGNETMEGITTATMLVDTHPETQRLSAEAKAWYKKFFLAISGQESQHRYPILGVKMDNETHMNSQALSRYQIMPREWMAWSNLYLGEVVEPTAQAVEYITFRRFTDYYEKISINPNSNRYMFYTALANKWFWGHIKTVKFKNIGTLSEATDYSKEVLNRMGLQRDAGTAAVQEAVALYNKGGKAAKKAKATLDKYFKKFDTASK